MVNSGRNALVLITGAGSGIGAATAHAFARRGARVLAVDVNDAAAKKTASDCYESGAAEAAALACDVGDWDQMRQLASDIGDRFGPLDVLVNNAGVGMTGRFTHMSVEDWRWIRDVNLDGVVHGCLAFGPPMVERGSGHVVNMSSGLGYTPRANEPAYVTTKAAVLALSRCLRADWSAHGVGVSAVCPGVINTPIISSTRVLGPDADRIRARATRLFRRGHSPADVAEAVVHAVTANRAVVTVGWEAKIGWALHRYLPVPLQQRLARAHLL
jgi:2-hydroxycyclohexanecarboxyl-CoA dehydrogenase